MDITYIPMRRGFVYLAAVVDWAARRVLSHRCRSRWRRSSASRRVEEALAKYGKPEIFNTDQGSQFTSLDFTGMLLDAKLSISMDGKGAWRDNVFVERLWRSVKYEEVYLRAYDSVPRRGPRSADIWRSTTSDARIRALTDARPTRPISAIKKRRWPHDRRRRFFAALVGLRPPDAATKSKSPAFSGPRAEIHSNSAGVVQRTGASSLPAYFGPS